MEVKNMLKNVKYETAFFEKISEEEKHLKNVICREFSVMLLLCGNLHLLMLPLLVTLIN